MSHHVLSCLQPATHWADALPLGNGVIGAAVYGQIRSERILLNHSALSLPQARPELPDVSEHLGELRRRLRAGDFTGAAWFYRDRLEEAGYGRDWAGQPAPYQPAAELRLVTEVGHTPTHYRRRLDRRSGEVHIDWCEQGAARRRSCFVSRADDLIALRWSGTGTIDIQASLMPHNLRWEATGAEGEHVVSRDAPCAPFCPRQIPPVTFRMWAEADLLCLRGTYASGASYGAMFRVRSDGAVSVEKDCRLRVEGATSLDLIGGLFCFDDDPDAAQAELAARLRAEERDYDQLLASHHAIQAELYQRCDFALTDDEPEQASERLLLDAGDGAGQAPAALYEQLFHHGRYLAIATNAPGGLPANLQGLWNGDYRPAFQCDVHHNVNLQMCYWPQLPCGMPELLTPLIDHCHRWLEDWRSNARKLFGCRGILPANNQTTDGVMRNEPWLHWPSAGAWLCQHLFDAWQFTGDDELLRERILPIMREVALFYEDFLCAGEDDHLHLMPSVSPENYPDFGDGGGPRRVTVDSTMDVACCRELLGNLITACQALDCDAEDLAPWQSLRDRLPAYRVNADGALAEWIDPRCPDNDHHRHASHLYPLFPGTEITPEHPLFAAAAEAVERRAATGARDQCAWSLAQLGCLYARLGRGDDALDCLDRLVRSCCCPNLWLRANDHRDQGVTLRWFDWAPFQIDASFGLTAAILEMLVQSRPDTLRLLPALPTRWQRGRIAGVHTRCGVILEELRWDRARGELAARIRNPRATSVSVRIEHGLDDLATFERDTIDLAPEAVQTLRSPAVPA